MAKAGHGYRHRHQFRMGGLWGALTHAWAISRGIPDNPAMLQGASPVAVVVFPIFEFTPYWCVTVSLTFLVRRLAAASTQLL